MEKYLNILGWIAVAITLYMEISYFSRVVSGDDYYGFSYPSILSLMNNMLWVGHGLFKNKKDWPLIIANGFVIVMVLVEIVYSIVRGF